MALTLVQGGAARSRIVVGEDAPELANAAAEDLHHHIQLASGAVIPISEGRTGPGQEEAVIVVGSGSLSRILGVDGRTLREEEFVVRTRPLYLVLAGRDTEIDGQLADRGMPTLWAVAHLLDRYLGVRWLWPGEAGTFVPKRRTFEVPEIDERLRPSLEARVLYALPGPRPGVEPMLKGERAERFTREAKVWMQHHLLGSRCKLTFSHCFAQWWKRYHEDHPDYFAVCPPAYSQPCPSEDRVKLNLGNPAVEDQVIAEWEEAGRPESWCVGPNDGAGFCVGEATRAMDDPPDQPTMDIWEGKAKLGTRYVKFWNGLITRMRQKIRR